jgi:hypothetical protein
MINVTHPDKVKKQHGETLEALGFKRTPTGFRAAGMIDAWERNASGQVQARVLDGSSLEALAGIFETLHRTRFVLGYGSRIRLPDGSVRFGVLLVKDKFLTSKTLRTRLGFDPTALICKKA